MKAVDVLAQLTGSIGQFEWNKEVLLRDIYSAGELRVLVWAVPDGKCAHLGLSLYRVASLHDTE